MIGSLRGILRSKSPTEVTVDVNGVGYVVNVSLATSQRLGSVNDAVSLLTHLHVREDAMQLFGFADEEERRVFLLLLSISGIGPRTALGILSGTSPGDLTTAIARKDHAALTALPNIGRKTAERLILELRDKVASVEEHAPGGGESEQLRTEALLALSALGFSRPVAEKAIRQALSEGTKVPLTVEELVRRALRRTGR